MAHNPFIMRATGGDADEAGESLVRPDEVRVAMSVLPDPKFGVQVQALPSARWKTCRGDDPAGIAAAAVAMAPGQRGVYWTLQTMSTLGYGDVTFSSDAGRLFSMIVLVTGLIFLFVLLPFTLIQLLYAPWLEARNASRTPREL